MAKLIKKSALGKLEQNLDQMYYDLHTLKRELLELNDVDLYDRCLMDIQMFQRHDLDKLYDKLAVGEVLTPKERRDVESFYILANMDFLVQA